MQTTEVVYAPRNRKWRLEIRVLINGRGNYISFLVATNDTEIDYVTLFMVGDSQPWACDGKMPKYLHKYLDRNIGRLRHECSELRLRLMHAHVTQIEDAKRAAQ